MKISVFLCLSFVTTVVNPVQYFEWRDEIKRKVDVTAKGDVDFPLFKKMVELTASRLKIKGYIIVRGNILSGCLIGYEADLNLMEKWLKEKKTGMSLSYVEFPSRRRLNKFQTDYFTVYNFNPTINRKANLSDIIDIKTQLHLVNDLTLLQMYPDLYKYKKKFYTHPTSLVYTYTRKIQLDIFIRPRPDELDARYERTLTLPTIRPRTSYQTFDNYITTTRIQELYNISADSTITSIMATRHTTQVSTRKAFETDTKTTTETTETRTEGTVVEVLANVTTVVKPTGTERITLGVTTPNATRRYAGNITKTAKLNVTKALNITARARAKKLSKEERKALKKEEEKKKQERKLEEAKNRTTTEKYSDRKRKPATV